MLKCQWRKSLLQISQCRYEYYFSKFNFGQFHSAKLNSKHAFHLKQQIRKCSDAPPKFPGSMPYKAQWTNKLDFMMPEENEGIPIYRVLKPNGEIVDGGTDPLIPKEECLHMYECMVTLNIMDKILYEAQRHGRLSFYMTNDGEEAVQVGSAAALNSQDLMWGQYREVGFLMYRGFPLIQFMHQCYGNKKDLGKGRQMPIHYGSKDLNLMTISSPLGTQLPQAVGSAYAFKMQGKGLCAVCFFGDGSASEGDAHGAFNFASTLECPVIFICRNNGFAISTPTHEQYRGDGIASRGVGYGIATIRVDGNDVFAVYNAVKKARELSVSESRPVLIEAMTYRIAHHSTSDDSNMYRPVEEIDEWKRQCVTGQRLQAYLIGKGWWTEEQTEKLRKDKRAEVLTAFAEAEREKLGSFSEAFKDVYDVMPKRIKKQLEETTEHFHKYKDKYKGLEKYES